MFDARKIKGEECGWGVRRGERRRARWSSERSAERSAREIWEGAAWGGWSVQCDARGRDASSPVLLLMLYGRRVFVVPPQSHCASWSKAQVHLYLRGCRQRQFRRKGQRSLEGWTRPRVGRKQRKGAEQAAVALRLKTKDGGWRMEDGGRR